MVEQKIPKSIEDLKTLWEKKQMEPLYSCVIDGGKEAIVTLADNGFALVFESKPGWNCKMHYQYLAVDEDPRLGYNWIVETTYESEGK